MRVLLPASTAEERTFINFYVIESCIRVHLGRGKNVMLLLFLKRLKNYPGDEKTVCIQFVLKEIVELRAV